MTDEPVAFEPVTEFDDLARHVHELRGLPAPNAEGERDVKITEQYGENREEIVLRRDMKPCEANELLRSFCFSFVRADGFKVFVEPVG